MLRVVTPGVVEVPRLVCQHCGTNLLVSLHMEADMPKITRLGGASNASAEVPDEPAADPVVDVPQAEPESAPSASVDEQFEQMFGVKPEAVEPKPDPEPQQPAATPAKKAAPAKKAPPRKASGRRG